MLKKRGCVFSSNDSKISLEIFIKFFQNFFQCHHCNENELKKNLRNLCDKSSYIDVFLFGNIFIYNLIIYNYQKLYSFNKIFGIIFIIFYTYLVYFSKKQRIITAIFPIIIIIIITCLLSFKAKNYICLKKLFHCFFRIIPSIIKSFYFYIKKYESKEEFIIKIIFYVIIDFFTFIFDYYLGDFLVHDYGKIIIFYYLILLIHYIIILFFYYQYFSSLRNYTYDFYIVEYKKIKIVDYYMYNFEKENKEKYLKDNCKNFFIKRSKEELDIIDNINNFRKKNSLKIFSEDNKFPDFLIKKQSEIFLFPTKKIFKSLNGTKYICKILEKDKDFLNDLKIKNILLKDDLDKINVIKQNDIIYILVFSS